MSQYTRQPPLSYSYSPRPPQSRPPRRQRRGRKVFIIIFVLLIASVLVYAVPRVRAPAKSAATTSPVAKPAAPPIDSTKIDTMSNAINGIINQDSNIDMSVSLIDLNSGQSEHYGDSAAFTAASTTKVITAADVLHQVEAGKESLSETINGSSAEYELQQMIVVSDDNAWNAFRNYLGFPQLQAYGQSIGLTSFQSQPNSVTSNDMALLLEKLWEGKILNNTDTQLVLGYMKQANYRQYIVPAVPSNDTIYHKAGFYEDYVHDEAIITSGSKAFVIVIFTNGNGVYDWEDRAEIMQQITQAALAAYF
jgi:beta-lactamase class A